MNRLHTRASRAALVGVAGGLVGPAGAAAGAGAPPGGAPSPRTGAGALCSWPFRRDTTSQRSAVSVGGVVAQRSSWIASIGGRAYAHHDDWSFLAGLEQYSAEYNFYGIGNAAGNADQAELVRQQGHADMADVLRRVYGHLYVGPQYRYDNTK